MSLEDIVSLEVSMVNAAHKCYTEMVDMIDTVLKNTKELFSKKEWEKEQSLIGRLVHLLVATESDQKYLALTAARKHLSAVGLQGCLTPCHHWCSSPIVWPDRFQTAKDTDNNWEATVDKIFKSCPR